MGIFNKINNGGILPGDSGGAVYRKSTAFGIVLAVVVGDATTAIYTPMSTVTDRFGTKVVGTR